MRGVLELLVGKSMAMVEGNGAKRTTLCLRLSRFHFHPQKETQPWIARLEEGANGDTKWLYFNVSLNANKFSGKERGKKRDLSKRQTVQTISTNRAGNLKHRKWNRGIIEISMKFVWNVPSPPPPSFTRTSYSGEIYAHPVVVWIFRRDQICTIKTIHSSVTTSSKQIVDEMRGWEGRKGCLRIPCKPVACHRPGCDAADMHIRRKGGGGGHNSSFWWRLGKNMEISCLNLARRQASRKTGWVSISEFECGYTPIRAAGATCEQGKEG
jgi:hypothetical protein